MRNLDDRTFFGQENPIPWQQFRDEFLAAYRPPAVAKSSASRMESLFRELEALDLTPDGQRLDGAEPLHITTTADLTVVLVSKYIANRPPGQSPYTTYSLLATLRSICRYAEASGYLRVCPFRLRKLARWVRRPPLAGRRHYSREEIRRVLELMTRDVEERTGWAQWRARRLLAVTSIIAYTGMRKMEALRLELNDVDMKSRAIWIRPHGASLKTSASEAPVPIPERLFLIMSEWLAHRMDAPFGFPLPKECPFLVPTISRRAAWVSGQKGGKALHRLQAVAARAGVPGMTFQGLRASLATHMEPFAGPALIQRILRHTSVRTSEEHYRKADIPNLVTAMNGFDF